MNDIGFELIRQIHRQYVVVLDPDVDLLDGNDGLAAGLGDRGDRAGERSEFALRLVHLDPYSQIDGQRAGGRKPGTGRQLAQSFGAKGRRSWVASYQIKP